MVSEASKSPMAPMSMATLSGPVAEATSNTQVAVTGPVLSPFSVSMMPKNSSVLASPMMPRLSGGKTLTESSSTPNGIDDDTLELLIRHGFRTAKSLSDAEAYEVSSILDIDEGEASGLIDRADSVLEQLIIEEAERKREAEEMVEDLPPEED